MANKNASVSHFDLSNQPCIFLGFPLKEPFIQKLNSVSPGIRDLFICPGSDYLQEMVYKEERYLGKFIRSGVDLAALEMVEANIYSILHKLVPDYSYAECPLFLFAKYTREISYES